jgi:hypothetical protein
LPGLVLLKHIPDYFVQAFIKASLNVATEGTFTHSISLSEVATTTFNILKLITHVNNVQAFESETVTRFETTVNNLAIGKWGDMVVTVGMTIKVGSRLQYDVV